MVIRVDFDVLVGQITRPDRKFPAAGTKIKVNAKFLSSDQLGQLRLGRACIRPFLTTGAPCMDKLTRIGSKAMPL